MAKRGGGANPTRDSAQEAASRAIAAHESSIKALKRERDAAGHQPPATRRHRSLMLARHHEGPARECRALARGRGWRGATALV
jgi:hypothetical protein